MSFIAVCSIALIVNSVYLTVCANNWSDKYNYIVCNVWRCGDVIEATEMACKYNCLKQVTLWSPNKLWSRLINEPYDFFPIQFLSNHSSQIEHLGAQKESSVKHLVMLKIQLVQPPTHSQLTLDYLFKVIVTAHL